MQTTRTYAFLPDAIHNPSDEGQVWAVSGRIPGDDDDTFALVIAQDSLGATGQFRDYMGGLYQIDEAGWKQIAHQWGDELFVCVCVQVATQV